MATTTPCKVVQVPGPQGGPGVSPPTAVNGLDAFSLVSGGATLVPAFGATVDLPLVDPSGSRWIAPTQIIYIQAYGFYQSVSNPDNATARLLNLGYPGNVNGNGVLAFAAGSRVSPGGLQGPSGAIPGGALLAVNNLIDVTNVATSRTNLGLGTAAVQNVAAFLQAANNLTDLSNVAAARTALALVPGANIQAFSSFLLALTAIAPGAADELIYLTGVNTFATATLTAAMRALLASASNDALLASLAVLPRSGYLGGLTAVNLNVATSDNAVTLAASRYVLEAVTVEAASVNLTTATLGVFTAAGGAGTSLAADQSLAACTASTKYHDLTLDATPGTDTITAGTVYVRVGTPQGVAATANVSLWGRRLN